MNNRTLLTFGKLVLFLFLTTFGNNLADPQPPETWKENWYEHNQLLTRTYSDNDVAIYFDPDVANSSTWMNQFFHDVWVYTKKVYGEFGTDPILYGIFHAGKYNGCHSTTYFDRLKFFRNVVDCGGQDGDIWKFGKSGEYDLIVGTVSLIIQTAAHGVNGNAAFAIAGHNFDHIITYDVYLGLNRTKDAQRWRGYFTNRHENVLGKEIYWFRDWFLVIYENYGGSSALDRFLELLSRFFPKSNSASFNRFEYAREMNYGEFFHFWSASAGKNLKNLVEKVFGWGDRIEKEFQNARKEFPQLINYYDIADSWQENWSDHKELLTKHLSDNEVSIYFDKDVDKSLVWMDQLVRDVWIYTKKVYGKFGENPILYAIFHSGKHSGSTASTFIDSSKLFVNVIECGTTGNWKIITPELIETIVTAFAKVVENFAHGISDNPAAHIWWWEWQNIFAYDVYLGINRTDLADRLYDIENGLYSNYPKARTYWFRDWFAPIYEQYGGSRVLNKFFELLAMYFPKNVDDSRKMKYSRDMNFGEFVYFWSGAAGNNLKGLAIEVFGWNQECEMQFEKAGKDFSEIKFYSIIF